MKSMYPHLAFCVRADARTRDLPSEYDCLMDPSTLWSNIGSAEGGDHPKYLLLPAR